MAELTRQILELKHLEKNKVIDWPGCTQIDPWTQVATICNFDVVAFARYHLTFIVMVQDKIDELERRAAQAEHYTKEAQV